MALLRSREPGRGPLVLQLAKLGDFLQTRAFLASLAAARPWEQPGVLLLDQRVAAVLPASFKPPGFEIRSLSVEVLEEAARLTPWPRALAALSDELEPLLKLGFETVYNLNTAPLAALLAKLTGAPDIRGPLLKPNLQDFQPYPAQSLVMSLRGRRRLGRFNLVDLWRSLAPGPALSPPEPAFLEPGRPALAVTEKIWPLPGFTPPGTGGGTVGFQMGAGHPARRLGVDFWLKVAGRLSRPFGPGGQALSRLVLLGALPDEERAAAEFISRWPQRELVANLTGRTDLSALSDVLRGLNLLMTVDTGVMHLAAALRIPVLAMFQGPAWAPETAPYAAGVVIHQTLSPCGPCLESGPCPHEGACPARPNPEVIAHAARRMIGAPENAGPALAWAESGRFWLTRFDSFGLTLTPWADRPPLSREELLALALREAGRPVFQPGYQTDNDELAFEAAAYDLTGLKAACPETALAALQQENLAAPFISCPDFRRRFKKVYGFVASR